MQGRAFSATIRPSASDSIILEVSRGMRMARNSDVEDEGRKDTEMAVRWGERVLEVPQWTVMAQVEGSLAILET